MLTGVAIGLTVPPPLPPAIAAAGCFLKVRIGNLCGDSRLKAFGY
jgi:hypothetical protein